MHQSREKFKDVGSECVQLTYHLEHSFTVFNASCLAKWLWCEVDDDTIVKLVVTKEMTPGLPLALRHLKVVLAGWPGRP